MADIYEDMYELEPPQLQHRRMDVAHRAKQFAPFAALKEHGIKIEETAEAVEQRIAEEEHRGFLYEDLFVYKEDELS